VLVLPRMKSWLRLFSLALLLTVSLFMTVQLLKGDKFVAALLYSLHWGAVTAFIYASVAEYRKYRCACNSRTNIQE